MNGRPSTSKDLADITNIIPPKLIKNYDVFIVLKPKENDKIEENNLIDFDTVTSSRKISEILPKAEYDGKKELSLINLYEDISVSPQALTFPDKSIDNVIFDPLELKSTSETREKDSSIDKYSDLRYLDRAYNEFGVGSASNSITIDKNDKIDYNLNEQHHFDHIEDFTFPKLNLTHEADEDLIDEVLSTNIQRLAINNNKYGLSNNKSNIFDDNSKEKFVSKTDYTEKISQMHFEIPKLIRTERQVSSPDIERSIKSNLGAIPKNNRVDFITQTSVPANTLDRVLGASVTPKKDNAESKITYKTTTTINNLKQYALPKQIYENAQTPEQIRRYIDDHLLKSKTKYCNALKYYNPKDFYNILNTKELEFKVETIQLDPKKYRQKRIIIEDSVAETYTAGPSVDEKKLVLPQIMDRLFNKKSRMDKFSECQPKLILDSGCLKKKEIPVILNPVVLTDDGNRDRLRNLMMRQHFYQFLGVDKAD